MAALDMTSKSKEISRVILISNGVAKRVFSLNLDLKSEDLYFHLKPPLIVKNQGNVNIKTGTLVDQRRPEITKIQHLHFIISKNLVLATYRASERPVEHSQPLKIKPIERGGKKIYRLVRFIPKIEHLVTHQKPKSPLDFYFDIDHNSVIAFEVSLGIGYSIDEMEKILGSLHNIYNTRENKLLKISLGSVEKYSVYISCFIPRITKPADVTRILIPEG